MKDSSLFIGLMSGTSLDGVDAALVDFSAPAPKVLATHFAPFESELRAELLALQAAGTNDLERGALAANQLAHAYAASVNAVVDASRIDKERIVAIGAHGQTVRHRPELGFTLQIGNPALLAELTSISVVSDFRSRDVAAGGQGAPLAPAFHQAFFAAPGTARVVLNLGGIANATLLDGDGSALGFDTGPANVLLDLWNARHRGTPHDEAGAWGATGKVLPALLRAMLQEPFFARPAPKSTGRDLFHAKWLDDHLTLVGVSVQVPPEDIQATLAELTAQSISAALSSVRPEVVYVCGGGAHNTALMAQIAAALAPARITTTEELGVPPDWVEAVAFAWLAERHVHGYPASLASVTGARGARILGACWPK